MVCWKGTTPCIMFYKHILDWLDPYSIFTRLILAVFWYLWFCPDRLALLSTGFPATLEIRENLENEFPIFQSGKTQGI